MLYYNNKIEVKKSHIHGYGVFAKENIASGEILEECHYLEVCQNLSIATNVFFSWPSSADIEYHAIVLGNGSIYNSSKKDGENNADWETDIERHLYIFRSIKDIKKGEEIKTYYAYAFGDSVNWK